MEPQHESTSGPALADLEPPRVGDAGDDAHLACVGVDGFDPRLLAIDQDDQPGDVGPAVSWGLPDQSLIRIEDDRGEILPGEDDEAVRGDGRQRCAFHPVDDLPVLRHQAGVGLLLGQHAIPLAGCDARQQRRSFLGVAVRDVDPQCANDATEGGGGEHQPPLTCVLYRTISPRTETVSTPCTVVERPAMTI